MCLNPGYICLQPNRRINLKTGTVNRWKLKKIKEEDYCQLKEQGFINTRQSKGKQEKQITKKGNKENKENKQKDNKQER
jgi:competence protein ComGC